MKIKEERVYSKDNEMKDIVVVIDSDDDIEEIKREKEREYGENSDKESVGIKEKEKYGENSHKGIVRTK